MKLDFAHVGQHALDTLQGASGAYRSPEDEALCQLLIAQLRRVIAGENTPLTTLVLITWNDGWNGACDVMASGHGRETIDDSQTSL